MVIESLNHARNGGIAMALINGEEATLERIEQTPKGILLHAENRAYAPLFVAPDRLRIQRMLVGQMRRYSSSM